MNFRSLTCVLTLVFAGCGQQNSTSTTMPVSEAGQNQNGAPVAALAPAPNIKAETPTEPIPRDDAKPTDQPSGPAESKPIAPGPVDTPQSIAVPSASNQTAAETEDSAAAKDKPASAEQHGDPLDLTAYYGTPAAAFDKIESYPWRDAPRGSKILGNISVEIGGMICLWGAANAERGLVFPQYVEGIQVGRKFEALYLLHATFHNSPAGTPVAHLILNYEDESFDSTVICCGTHVKDWLPNPTETLELGDPKSKVVFRNKSSMHPDTKPRELRFFITEIANKDPNQLVTSIDLVTAKENSASCILGMTTGPANLLKVDP